MTRAARPLPRARAVNQPGRWAVASRVSSRRRMRTPAGGSCGVGAGVHRQGGIRYHHNPGADRAAGYRPSAPPAVWVGPGAGRFPVRRPSHAPLPGSLTAPCRAACTRRLIENTMRDHLVGHVSRLSQSPSRCMVSVCHAPISISTTRPVRRSCAATGWVPSGRRSTSRCVTLAAESLSLVDARRLRGSGWEGDLDEMRGPPGFPRGTRGT